MMLLVAVSVYIAVTDISRRHIDNQAVLVVLALSLASSGLAALALWPLLAAILTGVLLFSLGIFGGGDIKLVLAFLPAISLRWWPVFFILVTGLGAVLALGYLGYGLYSNRLQAVRQRGLPYGVAIVLAGIFGVWLSAP